MSARKGQIWSIDLIASAMILSFIIVLSMMTWNGLALRWNSANDYTRMQTEVIFATDALMMTPGVPSGWEMMPTLDDSIVSLGIVNARNEIENEKIQRLVDENATSYELIKRKLGLQRHDLGVLVTSLDGSETFHKFGVFGSASDTTIISKRIGILNGSKVFVTVEVSE